MLYFWEIVCFAVGRQERKCKCEVRVCSKGPWPAEPGSVQAPPAQHLVGSVHLAALGTSPAEQEGSKM